MRELTIMYWGNGNTDIAISLDELLAEYPTGTDEDNEMREMVKNHSETIESNECITYLETDTWISKAAEKIIRAEA